MVVVTSLLAWWAQAGPLGASLTARAWPRLTGALPQPADTPRTVAADTTTKYKPSRRPKLRQKDRPGSPFAPVRRRSPLMLPLPPTVKLNVTVDDSLKHFNVEEKVGKEIDYRDPSVLSYKEYSEFQRRQAISQYYRDKANGGVTGTPAAPGTAAANRLIPKIYLGPVADRIFGGSYVDIRPAGSVTLKLGARFNTNENPALTLRQQSVGDFIFEQNMNINLTGQIGTKLKLVFNYDTKASFDFENQMKFDFGGKDTDILQKLDLGNVSLPLTNTLVQGGQNLFGIKTQLRFGKLDVTAVAATVRGTADEVRVQNGAQSRQYELKCSQYEKDRHFFLSQFFRERYDQALRSLPTVQSGVEIRNLEVYVTNDNRTTDNLRNMVALMDLGEPLRIYRDTKFQIFPSATSRTPAKNLANKEYATLIAGGTTARGNLTVDGFLQVNGLQKNLDYERVRARKLDPREYTYNSQLGYLNLNTGLLPDQVLGVSFEYVFNGQTYKVGENVQDYGNVGQDQVIFMKLLKATNPGVNYLPDLRPDPLGGPPTRNTPTWDLMMKNIYPLNASQLNRDNFQLQIIYKDDATGVDLVSLKEGCKIQNIPLIQVLGLDRVNPNNDRNPDGNFDYFPGITIDPELGKIIFPNVQPFGSNLRAQFDTLGTAPGTATGCPNPVAEKARVQKYVYQQLYNQTQSDAQQIQEKDKFFLRGRFQATATDEINLPGIGIAQGSVRVRSGSTLLTEGTDYQVFYDQAKVKILNPAYLNSANELRVEFEKNALVQVQPRRLLGTRLDYKLSKDVNLGGTALYMLENQAPGINRVNVGDEPANNGIVGLDGSIRKDSRVLTKYLDKLPLISTKEVSTIAFGAEVAKLIPGQAQLGRGENGVSYIDDFENARTPYTLGGLASIPAWRLATTPSTILADNGNPTGLGVNYHRAKLAWYTIDQTYYTSGPNVPTNITTADLQNHYIRGVQRNEIFPNKDLGATGNGYEYSFDMAYFPGERGPYNYVPGVAADGRTLPGIGPDFQDNFGGVSRAITFDTDFDNANIEYLEFWMMDPFIKASNPNSVNADVQNPDGPAQPNTSGGELYINLGNVSEDVLRDQNQHEFENGLPVPGVDPTGLTAPTIWGQVTRQQFLTDAFSAAPGARTAQDVGLDGLNDTEEQTFFQMAQGSPYGALTDPSADNFRHHLDASYDAADTKILGRYKNYNGYQGNSPEGTNQSSTAFPDKEDLNRDNVVQDTEQYYEYKIPLHPGQQNIGQNYIIDKVTNTINGDAVTWYQFRVPVREPSRTVQNGATSNTSFGFKNIRFLRMYMTGWQEPVVVRLVQPQFVANQWRRYLYRVADGKRLDTGIRTDADAFSVSTVSVEENGLSVADAGTGAIPYVTPPGIQRDKEYGSTSVSRIQNEQSLRLCVDGLRDGYAKAAYKNISINLLRYKHLRMYLHADTQDRTLKDGDVRAFIRIGTDYTQNYYEYSLPLKITQPGATGEREVWPVENDIDVLFQDFIDAKAARNQQANPNLLVPYPKPLANGATITVLGNPDFSAVQGCMIGILNPTNTEIDASAGSKSVCLWADEFRVFDFETDAGYAATARLNVKLADVATFTATGSFTSIGFGGLQDKAQARSVDDVLRGDLNATVAADKFLPRQLNLRVPVLLQLGHESRTPKYDPLDPDTRLDQSLQKFKTNPEEQASYRDLVIDRTTSRSISVLNVRKERGPAPGAPPPPSGAAPATPKKPKPWDIENFAVSYSITERLHTDIRTQRDYTRSFTAAVAYVYQTTPKNYTPLGSFKALDNPYLKIFQQVNFTPLPSRFSFRTDIDRRYNERFLQRVTQPGTLPTTAGIPGIFQKSFFINRIYDLRWDLTKSLIFDYTATNRGVIDEGVGRTIGDSQQAINNREQLKNNLLQGGRTTNFNQTASLTYRLPLDKFPLTDWLSADTRYSANYTWQAASTALRTPTPVQLPDGSYKLDDTTTTKLNLGNTIQNNAQLTANGKIDLVKLYNKVKFLNIINNAPPSQAKAAVSRPRSEVAADKPGEAITRPKPEPKDTAKKDPLRFVKGILRAVMTARSLNFTYAQSQGTLLPGYLPRTKYFGLENFNSLAPGLPFILGKQYDVLDINSPNSLYKLAAVDHNWYTDRSEYLNTPLSSLLTQTINVRTALEPFRDFNIQVNAAWQRAQNKEAYYRHAIDTLSAQYVAYGGYVPYADRHLAPVQALGTGTFSASTITIQTLFGDLSANGEKSKAFDRFVENRGIVQQRLAAANPNPGLYGYNSQDVLIQSFTDAYQGRSSDGYAAKKFNPFDKIPLPNWRVDYNGFSQLELIKQYFSSFTINHAYSSLYNVGSYSTATRYTAEPNDFPSLLNSSGQFIPYYVIGQVSIVEQLSPLIGVNFQTVNKITGRTELRTNRSVALNTTNAQITEVHTEEIVIGAGYATKNFKLPFRIGGEQVVLKNNLTARLDLSIRDNVTVQRSIRDVSDPGNPTGTPASIGISTSQITNGSRQYQLRPTVDYLLNTRLNLQLYFSQTITTPRVANAFRNSTTEGGFQLRYSLTQ